MFAASAEAAAQVTRSVKAATSIPCIIKLSPNVPDIGAIARAVVAAGADAITAINTMPGMLVDAETGAPVLANRSGGISGPALKPIALRCVHEIASAVERSPHRHRRRALGPGCGGDDIRGRGLRGSGLRCLLSRGERVLAHPGRALPMAAGPRVHLSAGDPRQDPPAIGRARREQSRRPCPAGRKTMPDSLHRPARVTRRIVENAKTVSLVLDVSMTAAPGQFAMLWIPGMDEKPFSISDADPLQFTIARVGPFSDVLHALEVGDTLWVRGPFGTGILGGSGAHAPRGRRLRRRAAVLPGALDPGSRSRRYRGRAGGPDLG